MSKSIHAILGLGLCACVLLALMMQHLLAEKERVASPYDALIGAHLGSRADGLPEVREVLQRGRRRFVVRARIHGDADDRDLAERVGGDVWLAAQRLGTAPDELVVILIGDEHHERAFGVARPSARPPR